MKKIPKQYSSVESELELGRRVPKISRRYPNDEAVFDAARKAGMNTGK